jgi:alanine racemase
VVNWVELDAAAIRWNIEQFRGRLEPGTRLGLVVKSNAYGHGMLPVAEIARQVGVEWLCVNNLEEALALREAGHRSRILIMGYVPLDGWASVVEGRLTPVIYNLESAERLAAVAARRSERQPIHLKLETGTHRQGIPEAELPQFLGRLQGLPALVVEGVTTHFANIEDTTDHGFAEEQIAAFARVSSLVRNVIGDPPLRHAACSAATLLFSRTHLDLARIGISLYGLWPSRETFVSCLDRGKPRLDLRPALTWKTRVAQIKSVPEGGYVGYGCTYRATRPSRIAVLPVGYHEGYDRGLSGVAHVLIHGRRAPVRGRVCMNMSMVDVTDIPEIGLEDEVVLLGRQGAEVLPAEQLAAWCGTIAYEIVARIHPALPRRVVQGDLSAG